MVDQNNIGTQDNQQVIMGGNPFDLVDNKNVQAEQNVPDIQQENLAQNQEVVQNIQQTVPVQQNVPVQNNVVPQQNVQVQQNIPVQQTPVVEEKGPGNFMKGLIKFVAKVSGQPDPETGKGENKVVENTNVPQNNTAGVVQPVQKSGNAFDSIMGGVTGFLDKVEKKVEKVSGVDIDSLGSMPKKEDTVQNPVQQIQSPQDVQSQQTPIQQPTSPQISVEKNISSPESNVGQVPHDVSQVTVQEPKVENVPIQAPVQNQVAQNNISPQAGNAVVVEEKKEEDFQNTQMS